MSPEYTKFEIPATGWRYDSVGNTPFSIILRHFRDGEPTESVSEVIAKPVRKSRVGAPGAYEANYFTQLHDGIPQTSWLCLSEDTTYFIGAAHKADAAARGVKTLDTLLNTIIMERLGPDRQYPVVIPERYKATRDGLVVVITEHYTGAAEMHCNGKSYLVTNGGALVDRKTKKPVNDHGALGAIYAAYMWQNFLKSDAYKRIPI